MSVNRRNPYADGRPLAGQFDAIGRPQRDPNLSKAPGFNALMVDRMLREAYASGHRDGELEVERRNEQSDFARVYDEGFDAALRAERDWMGRTLALELAIALREARELLESPKSTIARDRDRVERITRRLGSLADGVDERRRT